VGNDILNSIADSDKVNIHKNNKSRSNLLSLLIPFVVSILLIAGFTEIRSVSKDDSFNGTDRDGDYVNGKFPKINFLALLTQEQFSENLRDTVYTDKNVWLELRIDEQVVYVHYKDGRLKKYPVSSGNKFLSKGIESRPGLFAIFLKEELHLSSQFDDAKMYNYMPFNMGIGFHSLEGTGYYGSLGVRPSSHGCIRMRHEDAKALFNECGIGTLVLAHRGKTARVIAFAPDGFKNEREYTKDDYMNLLAYNLNSIYEGKYFINQPKRFIIDPSVIPRIGFNVGSTDDIPGKQQIPVYITYPDFKSDKLVDPPVSEKKLKDLNEDGLAGTFQFEESDSVSKSDLPGVTSDLVKKLVYNPGGILPYFPPDKEKVKIKPSEIVPETETTDTQ
jgi:hypothetical protein